MQTTRRESVIAIVERIGLVDREEWNLLLDADDSPFVEWDWLFALEESGCVGRRTGWKPCHIIVRDKQSGQLLAACPLYLKTHSMGEFVFDQGWSEVAHRLGVRYYPKLLVAVPFTPHTGRRFLVASGADRENLCLTLAKTLVALCRENKLSSVHVNFCTTEEAEVLTSVGFIKRLGYQYHWQNQGYTDFDDYLSRLRHKRRYSIKRERDAIARANISIRVHEGDEIPDHLFPVMFELYRSTVEKFYWGQQYLNAKFFDLMRTNFKSRLCFVCAHRGGNVVAGTFNVQKGGTFYGRYWGCFEEISYLHFNVSYYAAIEHCIRRGFKRFEPGAGGEYKWLRGFDPVATLSAHYIADPELRRLVSQAIRQERRQVEEWIAYGRANSQLKPIASSGNGDTRDENVRDDPHG